MNTFIMLIRRNTKMFFKDKGTFFTSLIAPLIILFLFIVFLGDIYRDSLVSFTKEFPLTIPDRVIEGFAGGWLISSMLAVCCVSVAFSANMIMVQDKATGRVNDLTISPVNPTLLAASYYVSTVIVTLIINFVALAFGMVYIAIAGWYLSALDVFLTILDVIILVMFGTALSSIVCYFLRSQGGITAVTTIISAAYGFLCGAYMPISNYSPAIGNVLKCLPGTYGTSLLHTHLMGGALDAVADVGFPSAVIDGMSEGFDMTLTFFDSKVAQWQSYLVILAAVVVLVGIYSLLHIHKKRLLKLSAKA